MMKQLLFTLLILSGPTLFAQDWDGIPVPADPGAGMEWALQDHSDDFNYEAPADTKSAEFFEKWTDYYHNTWTGPGLTIWDREHVFVSDGLLQIPASRYGTNQVNTGCITSKQRVVYPVYIEARVKIANSLLASDVWLLSPDDTQEIDICEAYGAGYCANTGEDQTWFAERIHISHHVFIRNPFQDYQPKDMGSWYYNGTTWRNDFHRTGVYWKDPWNLEYYIDGNLVRTVSGESIIDPLNYTGGTGLNKEMDIIIDVEDQNWRSDQGITPTDDELAKVDDHTFKVDWIRIYKPVESSVFARSSKMDAGDLAIFPNPAIGSFQIRSEEPVSQIMIYHVNGQLVHKMEMNAMSGTVHTHDLEPGLYLLKVQFQNGMIISRKLAKS